MMARTEATRLARRSDPESSKTAAERLVSSGAQISQKARVLAALREHPGATSAELALAMGVSRYTTARRLPDLERDGLVRRGPERKCLAHEGTAMTWHLRIAEPVVVAMPTDQLDLFGGSR